MSLTLPGWARRLTPKSWADRARRLVWRLPNLAWTLPSGLTVSVESRADWVIYNDVFAEGTYDAGIAALVERAGSRQQVTVLDLGANVGYFTLRVADQLLRSPAAARPWQLVLVEGSPELVPQLERRVASQPGLGGHLRIVHGLVGSRQGTGELFAPGAHFDNTTLASGRGRGIRVPYVDLAALVPGNGPIDLLKCDIEGSELAFLETYPDLLARVEIALFELHRELADEARCRALLAAAGLERTAVLQEMPATRVELFERRGRSKS